MRVFIASGLVDKSTIALSLLNPNLYFLLLKVKKTNFHFFYNYFHNDCQLLTGSNQSHNTNFN